MEVDRRFFLKLCGLSPFSTELIFHKRPKLFSVFGLHDTPNIGGSLIPDMTITDVKSVGGKSLVVLDPSEQTLKAAAAGHTPVLSRAYLPDNRFHGDELETMLLRLKRFNPHPVVQPYNEVNLLAETGNIPVSPEEHMRDFLSAAEIITSRDGMVLLTPLAQKAEVDEIAYLQEMLMGLNDMPSWLTDRLGIGIHNYIFGVDEDQWPRVMKIHQIVQGALGRSLPIYITEMGLYQNRHKYFDQLAVAEETVRLIDERIPAGLRIESANFWVLANFAQRPKEHQKREELHDYELSAWRGLDGQNQVFWRVLLYSLGLR